jgi:hypothetical protein
MSDTIQDNERSAEINNDFEEIIEKSEKLKKDYYKRRTGSLAADELPELTIGTWITGLSEGEIIDIKVDDNDDVILTTRIKDNGNVRDIKVRDRSNTYTENNELVRLLEYKNIKEGNIPDLLGKKIPLYINRYALPSNELIKTRWKPYLPKRFDKIGLLFYKFDNFLRNIGYEGEFSSRFLALSFFTITVFWWSVAFLILNIGISEIITILTSYNELLFVSVVISVIFTIYTPFISRVLNILKEKYIHYKSKKTIAEE